MKQLTCEMCGGTDIIKQNNVFICQTCGTKYSVEDAKKMMIEGKVDVSGSTVIIDNSNSVEKFYTMAELAYNSGNYLEAETYCNKIIEINFDHYKAWFLKGRAAGWQSSLANLRIEEAVNCFSNAVLYAPDEEKEAIKNAIMKEFESLCLATVDSACGHFKTYPSEQNAINIGGILKMISEQAYSLFLKCGVVDHVIRFPNFVTEITKIIHKSVISAYEEKIKKDYLGNSGHPSLAAWNRYKEQWVHAKWLLEEVAVKNCKDDAVKKQMYEYIIFLYNEIIASGSYCYRDGKWVIEYCLPLEGKQKFINNIMECHKKIKEIDPNYVIPERPSIKGGCYIATAVYGSYDCPQVWTLRRYRDYSLSSTWYGRIFIRAYYAISPSLVKWFGNNKLFRSVWKKQLDCLVEKLREMGYTSTPYKDL